MSKLQIIIEAIDQASAPLKKLKGEFDALAKSVKGAMDIGAAGGMLKGAVTSIYSFAEGMVEATAKMQEMQNRLKASVVDQRDLAGTTI